MEFQFPSSSILFTFLLFVFMILRMWRQSKTTHSTLNLPPGPFRLPLIGNLHLLVGSLPHHRLRDLALKYGPVMHLQFGEVPHVIISSAETAREILKTHDINFAQRPRLAAARVGTYNYSDIAFAPYGNYWRQLRKICTLELLSLKRVQSYRSVREEEVSNLIRSIYSRAGSPINFTKMVFALTNNITARAAFGSRCKDGELFKDIIQKMIDLAGGFTLVDLFPSIKLLEVLSGMRSKAVALHRQAEKICENIIKEHRDFKAGANIGVREADDLVHVLLNLQENGQLEFPLTNDNIKAVIMDMFAGGSETSSSTVEWAMVEMLKNPRVLEKAQLEVRKIFDIKGNVEETGLHELQYLKLVIREVLRLHPPLPLLLPRECRESCKIFGYDVPAGTKVIVNGWAIGMDPKYWTDAESFFPERFLDLSIDYKGNHFEYIPFGSGRRICPGMTFGLANLELPLAHLLYHFNWKLPNGMQNKDIDMFETFGAAVRRKNDLYLIPIPYHPLPRD